MNTNVHVVFTDNDTYTADLDGVVALSVHNGAIRLSTQPDATPNRVIVFPADKVWVVDMEEVEDDE